MRREIVHHLDHRSRPRRWLDGFIRRAEGISVTEYGILVAFLALMVIAIVAITGGGLSSWFATKSGQITTY